MLKQYPIKILILFDFSYYKLTNIPFVLVKKTNNPIKLLFIKKFIKQNID